MSQHDEDRLLRKPTLRSRLRVRNGAVVMTTALALSLSACENETENLDERIVADEAAGEDGDWIRIDGTIVSAAPSEFVLDYGEDTITVEVDDWDFAQEGQSLLPGDRVSVTGRVDQNLFDAQSIEASAVYLHNLNVVYYASAADEEEFGLAAVPQRPQADGVDYIGWVTGTSDNGFTLGTGPLKISVDTIGLQTPLAEQSVDVGDRVYVWGDLEISEQGRSALVAEGLVELVNSARGDSAPPTSAGAAGDRPADSGSEQ